MDAAASTPNSSQALSVLERRRLRASTAVVEFFVRTQQTHCPVAELVEHAGVSERSFYRYFPRKEDVIVPFLQASIRDLAESASALCAHLPLSEALIESFSSAHDESAELNWSVLPRVLGQNADFRATLLQSRGPTTQAKTTAALSSDSPCKSDCSHHCWPPLKEVHLHERCNSVVAAGRRRLVHPHARRTRRVARPRQNPADPDAGALYNVCIEHQPFTKLIPRLRADHAGARLLHERPSLDADDLAPVVAG